MHDVPMLNVAPGGARVSRRGAAGVMRGATHAKFPHAASV
jgi:hypothetical protein